MKTGKLISIVSLLVILDQLTKYLFQNKIYMLDGIGIEYTTNTGAAFGILKGSNIILAIVSLLAIAFIFYYYRKAKNYERIGLILLLSGTIGNLLDRIIFGYVRDFIVIYWWPNFNIADAYNVLGILIILFIELKHKKP